jgi:hypothetical protein
MPAGTIQAPREEQEQGQGDSVRYAGTGTRMRHSNYPARIHGAVRYVLLYDLA